VLDDLQKSVVLLSLRRVSLACNSYEYDDFEASDVSISPYLAFLCRSFQERASMNSENSGNRSPTRLEVSLGKCAGNMHAKSHAKNLAEHWKNQAPRIEMMKTKVSLTVSVVKVRSNAILVVLTVVCPSTNGSSISPSLLLVRWPARVVPPAVASACFCDHSEWSHRWLDPQALCSNAGDPNGSSTHVCSQLDRVKSALALFTGPIW